MAGITERNQQKNELANAGFSLRYIDEWQPKTTLYRHRPSSNIEGEITEDVGQLQSQPTVRGCFQRGRVMEAPDVKATSANGSGDPIAVDPQVVKRWIGPWLQVHGNAIDHGLQFLFRNRKTRHGIDQRRENVERLDNRNVDTSQCGAQLLPPARQSLLPLCQGPPRLVPDVIGEPQKSVQGTHRPESLP